MASYIKWENGKKMINIDGNWVEYIYKSPFKERLKNAWKVLKGELDAIKLRK